jgi:hypothetical protein
VRQPSSTLVASGQVLASCLLSRDSEAHKPWSRPYSIIRCRPTRSSRRTDCDIEEPAGSAGPCCYLVPRVLHTVHVDTASSGAANPAAPGTMTHELTIRGLVDPEGFKRDVWAMKRGEVVDGVDGTVAPLAVSMIRDSAHSAPVAPAEVTAPLLVEQNSLLREMLAAMKAVPPPAAPEAAANEELRSVAAALEETNRLLRQMVDDKK